MPQIPTSLEAFLDAHTWEESKQTLLRHPDLLTEEIHSILDQMGGFYELSVSKKGRTTDRIREHQKLLRRCREDGIEVAFADKRGRKSQTLNTLIRTFFYADSLDDIHSLIQYYPELLDEEVEGMIESVVGYSLTSSGARQTEERKTLLHRCREVGIEQAFIEHQMAGQLLHTIIDFLNINELDKSRHFVERHPELLTDEANTVLTMFIGQLIDHDQITVARDLRNLLENCRKVGIPAAYVQRRIELIQRALADLNASSISPQDSFGDAIKGKSSTQNVKGTNQIISSISGGIRKLFRSSEWEIQKNRLRGQKYAQLQRDLGQSYLELGGRKNIEKAIAAFENALSIEPPDQSVRDYAITHMLLARAYQATAEKEQIARSIEMVLKVIKLTDAEENPDIWCEAYYMLGKWYTMLPYERDSDKQEENQYNAIKCFKEALSVCNQSTRPDFYALLCRWLGDAYIRMPRDSEAEARFHLSYAVQWYQSAFDVGDKELPKEEYINVLIGIAQAHGAWVGSEREQHLQEAIKYGQQALSLFGTEQPVEETRIKYLLGKLFFINWATYNSKEALSRAKTCFEEAIELCTSNSMPLLRQVIASDLGDLHFHNHEWDAAKAAYLMAIGASGGETKEEDILLDPDNIVYNSRLRRNLAFCLWQQEDRDVETALEILEDSRARSIKRNLVQQLAMLNASETTKSRYHEALTNLRSAQQELKTIHPAGGERIAAFHYEDVDMWMAPVVLYKHEAPGKSSGTMQAVQQFTETITKLNQAENNFHLTIEKASKEIPALRAIGFTFQDYIASVQDESMGVIVPLITTEGATAFIICGGRVWATSLPKLNAKILDNLVGWGPLPVPGSVGLTPSYGYLGAYFNRHKNHENWIVALDNTLRLLGEIFWEPILADLPETVTRLTIIPQGDMWVLPLHAAKLSSKNRKLNNQPYLLDHYEVNYSPSVGNITLCQELAASVSQERLFAIINPQDDSGLQWSWKEGEAIQGLFSHSSVKLGKEATRDAVLNMGRGYHYIHIASHGRFNWVNVDQSGLRLADDWLTLRDFLAGRWDLRGVRLVTLSACETSTTDIRLSSEDEYISLPGAILLAGVPCVVGTLWAVDDFSTTLMMQRFYENHLKRHMSITKALQEAIRWLKQVDGSELTSIMQDDDKKYLRDVSMTSLENASDVASPFSHPFYWAAFVCVGF